MVVWYTDNREQWCNHPLKFQFFFWTAKNNCKLETVFILDMCEAK